MYAIIRRQGTVKEGNKTLCITLQPQLKKGLWVISTKQQIIMYAE